MRVYWVRALTEIAAFFIQIINRVGVASSWIIGKTGSEKDHIPEILETIASKPDKPS